METELAQVLTAIAVLLIKAWGIGVLVRMLRDPVRR